MPGEMDRDVIDVVERRKNSGIIMNGAAEAWANNLENRVETSMSLIASNLRKDFWWACCAGVLLVFAGCVTVAWVASKTDSRIGYLENGNPKVEKRLSAIEDRLNGIERQLTPMIGRTKIDGGMPHYNMNSKDE